jgi:hypothetical protein
MTRNFSDWLTAYCEYSSCAEAPRIIHFWAGVSAIAGALRRKVWFDQVRFKWFPSMYVVFVAPPAVLTKSTTADGSMELLKAVPGIKFGPNAVTWQKMCETLANSCESFEYGEEWLPMSAATFVASELGSLINFEDDGMINFLIELWDGKVSYEKQTKTSGDDTIEAPWVNILGCTTPQWVAANMNATTMGGGFTSRCIFIYGDKKENPIAYLEDMAVRNYGDVKAALIQDLEAIATRLVGPYKLTPEAKVWGKTWYDHIWKYEYRPDNPPWLNGYIGRKQAHLHKLAMVMAASKRDELVITLEDLQLAALMLTELEPSMEKTFALAGKSEDGVNIDRFLEILKARGVMPYSEAYKILQVYFPDARKIEGALSAIQRAGKVKVDICKSPPLISWVGE